MHYIDLVSFLKDRREELGVTQEYLAGLAGVGVKRQAKVYRIGAKAFG